MQVRLIEERDAAATLAIYNYYVTETTVTFDLTARELPEQLEWIRLHMGAHPAIVAVDASDVVIGQASLSAFRSRPAYNTTVESSVYVHPDHVGAGVGRQLLDRLCELAADFGYHTMIARITGNNAASIALHERCGFELVGVEREIGRKHQRWLDVMEMQRML